jgi:N6-L-threonylcarbamoyladenine synthase
MRILAIETSCDETALSIIESVENNSSISFTVLANQVLSQIDMHKEYGGVFPAVAKREHAKALVPLLTTTLSEAKLLDTQTPVAMPESFISLFPQEPELLEALPEVLTWQKPQIDAIAVTSGPGLEPALWVGINFAKALSTLWNLPLYPINHMEGHIYSSVLEKHDEGYIVPTLSFPALALLISGGHTELIHMEKFGTYTKIGETRDDAIGEAFDKVARLLGLEYPGGPKISKLAAEARAENLVSDRVPALPRPMIHSGNLHFSFSGIKTAVLYLTQKLGDLSGDDKKAIAREFEDAVTEVLITKCRKALQDTNAQTLIIGGGVSANTYIRKHIQTLCNELGVHAYIPERHLSTDNALMIGITALLKIKNGVQASVPETIRANGRLSLEAH